MIAIILRGAGSHREERVGVRAVSAVQTE